MTRKVGSKVEGGGCERKVEGMREDGRQELIPGRNRGEEGELIGG